MDHENPSSTALSLSHYRRSEASAAYEKLRVHLEAHRSYYENAIWAAEDPNDRFVRLDIEGLTPFVENVLVGFVGNRAMYPLRLHGLPSTTRDGITALVGPALTKEYGDAFTATTEEVVVSTPAVHTEAYLGSCELLEPYLRERRDVDLQIRRAGADRDQALALQQVEEVNRLRARLSHSPPLLEAPFVTPAPISGGVDDDFGDRL